ncbi:AMMECR1 domain-containing protein [Vibrio sp. PP-XX7]
MPALAEDRRFSPLTEAQLEALSIEVSVLSQPERLDVDAESALVAFLSEHKVGVIVSEHTHRALFLPQVWESLPDPQDFFASFESESRVGGRILVIRYRGENLYGDQYEKKV